MFGGDGSAAAFSLQMEETRMPYDARGLPQLQLFGSYPGGGGCGVTPINYLATEHAAAAMMNPSMEHQQQKFQISLNNNMHQDEGNSGGTGTLLNPNAVVSTGLRLSYEEDEHNSSVTTTASESIIAASLPVLFSLGNNLKSEVDRQNEELDGYLRIQEQNILKGLREMKQKHTMSFLNSVEKGVGRRLREKDAELESMNRKNKELTERIKQVAVEAQSWHYRAKYNESVVNVLQNNLKQVIAQGAMQVKEGCGDSEVDDAISSANPAVAGLPSGAGRGILCRACHAKEVRVLLLPCRHLCMCAECEAFIDVCPVCDVIKTVGVEVYMS